MHGDKADNIIGLQGFGLIKDSNTKKFKGKSVDFVEEHIKIGFRNCYQKIKEIYIQQDRLNEFYKNCILLRILTLDFFDVENQKPIFFSEDSLRFYDHLVF